MKENARVHTICECAVLLALSVVLSFVKIVQLPFDGAVTLFSMLPLCLISIRFGVGKGLCCGFCYAWFQILQGSVFSWGLTPVMLIASLLLDYLLAFTVLGLAGLFRRYGMRGMLFGIVFACSLRFLSHFLSGVIIWANFEEFVAFGVKWIGHPALYSLCYNGVYMLPETVMTVVGAFLLLRLPQLWRLIGKK